MDFRPIVGRRTLAPHERPREYNDPSKQDEPNAFYQQTRTQRLVNTLGIVFALAAVAVITGGIGLIVYNLVWS